MEPQHGRGHGPARAERHVQLNFQTSGCTTPIEAWHEGRYDWRNDTLEVADGQYVDIQLLKILVEALWPDLDKPMPKSPTRTPQHAAYTCLLYTSDAADDLYTV